MNRAEMIQHNVKAMKQWCLDNYDQGADVMAECWDDFNFEVLFGDSRTPEQAWKSLKAIASIYKDQQADARNSAF